MVDASLVSSSMDFNINLTLEMGTPMNYPTEYQAIVGSLQHLSFTRLDIGFFVNKLSQFKPTNIYCQALKRLLCYLKGTIDLGLQIHNASPFHFHAFYLVIPIFNQYIYFIYWQKTYFKAISQTINGRSLFTEVEYSFVAQTTVELDWLMHLLTETTTSPTIYCNNVGTNPST